MDKPPRKDTDSSSNESKNTLFNQLNNHDSAKGQTIVGRESCGEYILMDIIGKGGFGVVYKGLHRTMGFFVAIKKIRVTRKKKKDDQAQFETQSSLMAEINLLKVLSHHNIVRYIEHIPTSSHSYIIMEFIENGSLEKIIKKYGLLPESLISVYISQVLHGLDYLHRQGVIHRDIKAANLLISTDGSIKLADFGVATKVSDLSTDNPDDSFAGTPYWMAPEVIQMQGISTACDVWSLGCTIIELITGAPPYFGLAPASALFKIVQEDHPPIPPGISAALQDFLLQCFKKDENMRSNAKQLLSHPWLKNIQQRNPDSQVKNARAEILSYNAQLQEVITSTTSSIETRPRSKVNHPPTPSDAITHPVSNQIPLSQSPGTHVPWVQPTASNPHKITSIDKTSSLGKLQLASPRGTLPKGIQPQPVPTLPIQTPISKPKTTEPKLNSSSGQISQNSAVTTVGNNNNSNNNNALPSSPQMSPSINSSSGSSSPKNNLKLPKLNRFIEKDDEDQDEFFESTNSLLPFKSQAQQSQSPLALKNQQNQKQQNDKDEFDGFSSDEDDNTKQQPQQVQNNNNAIKKRSIRLAVKKDEEWNSEIEDTFDSIAFSETESQRTLNIHDKYKEQVTKTIIDLIVNLNGPNQTAETLIGICQNLSELFQSYPEERRLMITNGENGVYYRLPIISVLEILESQGAQSHNLCLQLLKLINLCMIKEKNIQEIICLMNGIPIITNFSRRKEYPETIREEVSKFVLTLCSTSAFSLNMFITGSRGCRVLVELLDSDYFNGFTLIHNSLDTISLIFKMNTPRTALCHLFAKSQLMYRLSLLLNQIFASPNQPPPPPIESTSKTSPSTPPSSNTPKPRSPPQLTRSASVQNLSKDQFEKVIAYSVKAADILLFFSSTGDSLVKEEMANENVIRNIVGLLNEIYTWRAITSDIRSFLLKILKVIKNLSMDSNSIRSKLDQSNVIPTLINFLKLSDHQHGINKITEIYNQCINALYYLLLLDKQRQERALKGGMLPPLLRLINERGPLKEMALPILFDFVRNAATSRSILWDCNTLDVLLDIIQDQNWFADAIESIGAWATLEPQLIYDHLCQSQSTTGTSLKLITILDPSHIKHPSFQKSLLPLLNLINGSSLLLKSLIQNGHIITSLIECLKVDYNSPLSKITLLKITVSIVSFIKNNNNNNNTTNNTSKLLIQQEQSKVLVTTLQVIAENDESEIAKKIAIELLQDLKDLDFSSK
ncbi:putative protein serine/threonine kinase [Tieghemostelium lacteum]|uniref:non-specific serine/threonine protein kinase n=1 Tax=Tieghemostelium lacteum TaxID=361077 RepID=A0A151Z2Z2_TIELA|nr:putative protein serine/threonine kinase [Tieghemostelium lacteum]|eukprot:KYQ88319.1 putative protein serine/threonine kinase [Tieghemostelium lacteum]